MQAGLEAAADRQAWLAADDWRNRDRRALVETLVVAPCRAGRASDLQIVAPMYVTAPPAVSNPNSVAPAALSEYANANAGTKLTAAVAPPINAT